MLTRIAGITTPEDITGVGNPLRIFAPGAIIPAILS
jgi:hypothetical protein